jgi:hypothetical protein
MAKYSASILDLARRGAEHRYQELKAELNALVRRFPNVVQGGRTILRRGRRAVNAAAAEMKPRTRKRMSPAARKAVSARMKKYWAAKRRAKKSS